MRPALRRSPRPDEVSVLTGGGGGGSAAGEATTAVVVVPVAVGVDVGSAVGDGVWLRRPSMYIVAMTATAAMSAAAARTVRRDVVRTSCAGAGRAGFAAMASPPQSTKTSLQQRLSARACQRWPQIAVVQVRFRGQFAYVAAELPDEQILPLMRLPAKGCELLCATNSLERVMPPPPTPTSAIAPAASPPLTTTPFSSRLISPRLRRGGQNSGVDTGSCFQLAPTPYLSDVRKRRSVSLTAI
jgi:hypothetical protein